MKASLISMCLLLALLLTGCAKTNISKEIQNFGEYVTKDVSEFSRVDLKKFDGTIAAYCAKPVEWFLIEDEDRTCCFVITESTKILNNKGKLQKHQMFNVGTGDIVEVKASNQIGSLSEEYNDVDAWFVCDTVKVLDTLEY